MSRTIAITSGKGGVGKTNLAVNLAIHLAELGHRTCLFDADLGTANINILLGIHPEYDIGDVIRGDRSLHDIIIRESSGIDIIPGSSGVEEIANLDGKNLDTLVKTFANAGKYDFYIFDTSAGISRNVAAFCLAASELLLVVTSEPTSLTDAYSLLKVLVKNGYQGRIRVVVNRCPDLASAKEVFKKFRMTADKYLGIKLEPLGLLYQDEVINKALREQKPFMTLYPRSNAANCIRSLARRLTEEDGVPEDVVDMTTFWNRCFQYFHTLLDLPGSKKGSAPAQAPTVGVAAPEARSQEPAGREDSVVPVGATVKPVAVGASATVPKNGSSTTSLDTVQALLPIVERLTDSILAFSQELSRVRGTMAPDANPLGPGGNRGQEGGEGRLGQEYQLDLRGFLQRNKSQNKAS
ncbi:MinD/ParA family protein [Desulfurivibrio sp. D14AmB]|uniref:MinD/ParA family protein n=1 Tax=Desulfurivibrio sp. D14AmB TaxID=3374370 RepID=UPI00376F2112